MRSLRDYELDHMFECGVLSDLEKIACDCFIDKAGDFYVNLSLKEKLKANKRIRETADGCIPF